MKCIVCRVEGEGMSLMHVMPDFLRVLPRFMTEEQKYVYAANKDLPVGTKYEIVDEDDVPDDLNYLSAWEFDGRGDVKTAEPNTRNYHEGL